LDSQPRQKNSNLNWMAIQNWMIEIFHHSRNYGNPNLHKLRKNGWVFLIISIDCNKKLKAHMFSCLVQNCGRGECGTKIPSFSITAVGSSQNCLVTFRKIHGCKNVPTYASCMHFAILLHFAPYCSLFCFTPPPSSFLVDRWSKLPSTL
jgi:hypothetical protein